MAQGKKSELKRTLSLPLLVFYGLGTVLGAGVYALIGKVAGAAGMAAVWAFVLAGGVAAVTAASYAELAVRFPYSAGAALYAEKAFASRILTLIVGFAVILTGIVSAATMSQGFAGYLQVVLDVPGTAAIIVLLVVMTALVAWGIRESVTVVAVITCIEIGGLLLVVGLSGNAWATLPQRWPELLSFNMEFSGLIIGTVLAFYAFIGFEDMVNVAEEAKDPRRDMPRAILITLCLSTVLYILVAVTALLALPLDTLAGHEAPLAAVLEQRGAGYSKMISVISMVAIINGVTVQIIMGSRLLYGLGKQYPLLEPFARLHPQRLTPLLATAVVAAGVLLFALLLPLTQLATLTSAVLLAVFALIHVALIRIKHKHPQKDSLCPVWLPWLGVVLCLGLLAARIFS
jgi:APA family basic amino acid/polyamine antiporter